MTDKETKPVVQEVEAPPIDPIPKEVDPMQQILQGMLAMQAQTNATLEKLSEKIDTIAENKEPVQWQKSEEDMLKRMNNTKIIERKMYKVLTIKQVLPMDSVDQQLHGDNFANGWIVWWDTNQRFDSKKEAEEYWEKIAPGKFKLLPVTVPIPEGQDYKKRRPNITM